MKKRVMTCLVLGLIAVVAWAQPITEQQALDRALKYLNNNAAAKARGMGNRLTKLDATKVEVKGIYAFNNEKGGYVIASGDSRALPVLGYASEGRIDWEKMPENMRLFLKSYDAALATLGDTKDFMDGNRTVGFAQTRKSRAAIAPLIKTTWDQGAPYWNQTPPYEGANPDYQGQLSVTGCVATALAQVMNYYQWPKEATTEIPAYDLQTAYEGKEKTWHIDALPPATFDWDNMLNSYVDKNWNILGTEAQQKAVSQLMRYCGQAVMMYYSPEFSGSDHQEVVEALIKYFNYNPALYDAPRVKYSIDEWEALIYNELAEGRPVQYGGNSDDGGHSFVCDGYDGDGLFHINWGWEGTNDGYFSLAVLNPYNNYSIGSGSGGIGFCVYQDAIIGVKPATASDKPQPIAPQAYLYPYSPLGVAEPDSAWFEYYFNSFSYEGDEVRVDFAFGTMSADGKLEPKYKGDPADSVVIIKDMNYHVVQIDSTAYQPGEYEVLYPMVKFRSIPGYDWQLLGAKENHVCAGRANDGSFFLYREVPDLRIKKAEITKGLGRLGMRNDVTLTVHNNGEYESTLPLVIVPLYFGDVAPQDITSTTEYTEGEPMWSDGFFHAGKDDLVTFCFKPQKRGTIYLWFAMPDGTYLDGTYIQVSDLMGSYNEYVNNESELFVSQADENDIAQGSEVGEYLYHVRFVDNPDATVPDAKPSDNIYVYACIADVKNTDGKDVFDNKEAYKYLAALPEKAGDGTYEFSFDLEYNITRGGRYYLHSYFNEWLNENYTEYLISCQQYMEFEVKDVPGIRVVGDTNVASGAPLDLQIRLTTGWPYDPTTYTGAEQAEFTIYSMDDAGILTPLRTGSQKLTFAQGDPALAVVDTLTFTDALADGKYLIRVDSETLGIRDVELYVGGGSGINSVVSDAQTDIYTDLKGMRLEGRPARKGVYIRDGKKVVVK